jgi:hypothetical protein
MKLLPAGSILSGLKAASLDRPRLFTGIFLKCFKVALELFKGHSELAITGLKKLSGPPLISAALL